eukprot:ANDGO_08260.mRNA.1 hypothetical protein
MIPLHMRPASSANSHVQASEYNNRASVLSTVHASASSPSPPSTQIDDSRRSFLIMAAGSLSFSVFFCILAVALRGWLLYIEPRSAANSDHAPTSNDPGDVSLLFGLFSVERVEKSDQDDKPHSKITSIKNWESESLYNVSIVTCVIVLVSCAVICIVIPYCVKLVKISTYSMTDDPINSSPAPPSPLSPPSPPTRQPTVQPAAVNAVFASAGANSSDGDADEADHRGVHIETNSVAGSLSDQSAQHGWMRPIASMESYANEVMKRYSFASNLSACSAILMFVAILVYVTCRPTDGEYLGNARPNWAVWLVATAGAFGAITSILILHARRKARDMADMEIEIATETLSLSHGFLLSSPGSAGSQDWRGSVYIAEVGNWDSIPTVIYSDRSKTYSSRSRHQEPS